MYMRLNTCPQNTRAESMPTSYDKDCKQPGWNHARDTYKRAENMPSSTAFVVRCSRCIEQGSAIFAVQLVVQLAGRAP